MGSFVWPVKLIRTFQFEHWWFLAMLIGLVIVPWTITLVAFPNVLAAYRDVPTSVLITSNLFAVSWGVANVLFGLCIVRIGVALTFAILTGLGASVAVTVPLVFKGSGLFKDAADVASPAGITVLAGIGIMLVGVTLATLAGFGRDRELKSVQKTSGSFLVGLIMAIIAGVTSAGIMLAFVYGQGPIVARVSILESGKPASITVVGNAKLTGIYMPSPDGNVTLPDIGSTKVVGMTAKAAADKIAGILHLSQQPEAIANVRVETQNTLAVFAVWAIGLLGGAVVNIAYPSYLMTKNRSWGILVTSWKEVVLSIIMGIQFIAAVALAGKGMILLGAMGASVGAGIQQAMQLLGGQGLGFVSGEWRGVSGKPLRQMYLAIAVLVVATVIMAYSNMLTG